MEIDPRESSRNVRYHPSSLSVHERTKTRPSTTTGHTPVNRWFERAPARTPMILLWSIALTTRRGSLDVTRLGFLGLSGIARTAGFYDVADTLNSRHAQTPNAAATRPIPGPSTMNPG